MSGRPVVPVPVVGADGLPLLAVLREALSGAGPAVAPVPAGRAPDPAVSEPLGEDEDDEADPVAAVVSTTGSSGAPKHVLLQASALLASAGATHDALGGAGTWLLPVPAHTVAGVQVLVRSLVGGTRPAVLDLAGGFDPAAFARAAAGLAARAPGRRYTSLVPAQLDLLLTPGPAREAAVEALGLFDAVLVGGAALPPLLREQAQEAGVRVVATYGMTETCGGCVYDGAPLPGVRIRVEPLDDGTSTTGETGSTGTTATGAAAGGAHAGAVGRVVLAGPVVARGYRTAGTPAGPGAPGVGAVRGPAGDGTEGFAVTAGVREFRTADRGTLVGGLLRLAGRTDDVVVSGGVNVSLDAVDRVLRAQAGVRDCLVVAVPSTRWGAQVAALLVPRLDGPPAGDRGGQGEPVLDEAVRAAVRRELGSAAVPRLLRHVDRLPLTGVGKPDRAAAVRVFGPARTAAPGLGDHGHPHHPTEEST